MKVAYLDNLCVSLVMETIKKPRRRAAAPAIGLLLRGRGGAAGAGGEGELIVRHWGAGAATLAAIAWMPGVSISTAQRVLRRWQDGEPQEVRSHLQGGGAINT